MEINTVYNHYRNNKNTQLNNYTARALPASGPIQGYIASVSKLDAITDSYKVIIPSMNNAIVDHVPRRQSDGLVGANGVGTKPIPLRPGQPVLIEYLSRTKTPIITGSLFLNGNLDIWKEGKVPSIDSKSEFSNNALFNVPTHPVSLSYGGFTSLSVEPLTIRSKSPNQPFESPSSIEIPGNWEVKTEQGDTFSGTVGKNVNFGTSKTNVASGTRSSLADVPIDNALNTITTFEVFVNRETDRWFSFVAGQMIPKSIRPHIPNELTDSFFKPVSQKLNQVLSFIEKASNQSRQQLNFLQRDLLPKVKNATDAWGEHNIPKTLTSIGSIFGLTNSFDVKINFSTGVPSIDRYINTQANALVNEVLIDLGLNNYVDLLTFNHNVPSIITGKQPLPLSMENGMIFGGLIGRTASFNPSNQSLSALPIDLITGPYTYEVADIERPTRVEGIMPFKLVHHTLNNIDFTKEPHKALASLLTKYGVPNAEYLTDSLKELMDTGSLQSILKILLSVGNSEDKLLLATLANFFIKDVDLILDIIYETTSSMPLISSCPAIDQEVRLVLTQAQEGNIAEINNNFRTYYGLDDLNIIKLVTDTTKLQNYLNNTTDLRGIVDTLFNKDILGFLVEVIYLTTGNDLNQLQFTKDELSYWLNQVLLKKVMGA